MLSYLYLLQKLYLLDTEFLKALIKKKSMVATLTMTVGVENESHF